MYDMEDNNNQIKIQLQDKILKYIILPLIPKFIRPNHITIFRFILTPFVVWLFISEKYTSGAIVFLITSFSDAVDGSLARTRNQITEWGKTYDPLADKLLTNSSLLVLGISYFFWTTLALIVIDMSFIFAGWIWKYRGIEIKANAWGKAKMNFQVIGLLLLIIAIVTSYTPLFYFSVIALYLACVFAIASFYTYGI
ncbi:hypothetical protein C4572_03910 [Candidatus Parcubacteria bacterium]|nr:MAG: hypothetical protein C4572_03910 [Candidatus Parcubacteria bacterium]